MKTNRYILALLAIGTLGAYTLWIIVQRLNPFTQPVLALSTFYIALFFTLTGILSFLLFYLHVWMSKNEIYYRNINIAFRQAVILSLLICGLIGLQGVRLLTWWDGLLLSLAAGITELICLARQN